MTYSVFSLSTGEFTGEVLLSGSEPVVADGYGVARGRFDSRSHVFDLERSVVVKRQPPAPPADEWQTWTWDADAWTWVSTPTEAALARDARTERVRRLLSCDWTQLPDVPAATAALWAPYRQALRDITEQPGFPGTITWPEEPMP